MGMEMSVLKIPKGQHVGIKSKGGIREHKEGLSFLKLKEGVPACPDAILESLSFPFFMLSLMNGKDRMPTFIA